MTKTTQSEQTGIKLIEIVVKGGMISLKEIPGQEEKELKDKYFDQFTTYAPFSWLGSRRLTKDELYDQTHQKGV